MSCSVDGCSKKVYVKSRQLCSMHYGRLRRTGTTSPGPSARGSLEDRFWKKVDKRGDDDCWNWLASGVDGYGSIGSGGRSGAKILAHRLSWEIHNGPIPESEDHHGFVVMHSCDNRKCVNPKHLTLGTQADNVKDMDLKGRRVNSQPKGSSHHMTSITEDDAMLIFMSPGLYKDIAKKFNCSLATVKSIKTRRTWGHITKPLRR
jgi:hypothetical protein